MAQSLPDISSVAPDLMIPNLSDGKTIAGKRVRLTLFPENPPIVLYRPTDWVAGKKCPVFIELAGNGNFKSSIGDTSSGLPEGSKIGYGLTSEKGFIRVLRMHLLKNGSPFQSNLLNKIL